jgi:hypothetical protein
MKMNLDFNRDTFILYIFDKIKKDDFLGKLILK